jgi:TolA-binding protein
MAFLCRWILVLTLLLAGGMRLWGASPGDHALDEAVKAFQDTFYARAEVQLADFCQKNPTSPRLPEAILLQAQARIKLTNYAGAIELLAANQAKAGANADQYLFWLGKAQLGKGDWRAASDAFAKLVKEQPASGRCLEAALGEAEARSALAPAEPAEWQRVILLLQDTNGVFQTAARTNAASELVPPGYLLLSEAQLAAKDYRAAEATLQPLTNRLLSPRLGWQWQYLLCRIQLADGRTNAALQGTTNLLAVAVKGALTNLLAESAALQAGLLEGTGRTNEALAAYQINLAEGIPAGRQREALLRVTQLSLAQNDIPKAVQTLETFLTRYPDAASADLALLTLGELRLRQYEARASMAPPTVAGTNAAAATNGLQLAQGYFETLVKKFPQSSYLGRAQLDLGWCYARAGNQAAFLAVAERLPASSQLATNYFRLAETQLQQTNYAGALKSYQAIVERFGALPEVKTSLLEPALDQSVHAGIAGGDLAAATNALEKLLALFPRSSNTASAVLLTAQDISRQGDPPAALKRLLDFDKAVPDAPLRPERQLAAATAWERKESWAEAIALYDAWLASFTNHPDLPQVEYYRARDTALWPGHATNALTLYANYIAHFGTNKLALLARMWVADYFYNREDYVEAQRNYLLLSHDTNWPPSELTYQAQLMAGNAAVRHQGWKEAVPYFTQLWNNTNGPSLDLRLQALFEYGDTLMSFVDPTETNKLANLEQATLVFGQICDEHPTNRLAALAWGRRGDCYLQWALARQQYDSLTNAINAYQRVVDSPQADAPTRSQARVGMAIALEKWAQQKTGDAQTAMLKQALGYCLDVVYGSILRKDELLDSFWTQKAAQEAFNVTEALQAWSQEASIYARLTNTIWPLVDPALRRRATNAFEHLEREKATH